MLNTVADGARNFLASEGTDGRIVSEVWVVMETGAGTKRRTAPASSPTGWASG